MSSDLNENKLDSVKEDINSEIQSNKGQIPSTQILKDSENLNEILNEDNNGNEEKENNDDNNFEKEKIYSKSETNITEIKNSKGEKIEKIKRVFKKKIKVALLRGEIAFKEAADFLKRMKPVRPLIFSEDILINLPETKEEIKDVKFLKKQAEKKKENY